MNKLWTIIVREYLVRVKSKSFILATILTPIAFGVLISSSALISMLSSDHVQEILVLDESDLTGGYLESNDEMHFEYTDLDKEAAKQKYLDEEYSIFIDLPNPTDRSRSKQDANYLSKEKLGINTIRSLEGNLARAFKEQRIIESNVDKNILESLKVSIEIENADYLDNNELGSNRSGKLNTLIGTVLGGLMGFLMYMVIFIYGGMVMRSVMEEKISRIVEVIISSVKPFQLMLGKIVGVGAVGLTQLLFWVILIPIILMVTNMVFGTGMSSGFDPSTMNSPIPQEELSGLDIGQLIREIQSLNWAMILPLFILFFLGGYFIYASFFAAIGSAIGDDLGESQSLMLPIMIPVIIAFIMLMPVLENPNGGLAIFGSIFPLFSPILMPARLAFDPPIWQIALSIVLLIGTVNLMIWLSGRIYRIGILLYGKKVNLKEIFKWVFYKT